LSEVVVAEYAALELEYPANCAMKDTRYATETPTAASAKAPSTEDVAEEIVVMVMALLGIAGLLNEEATVTAKAAEHALSQLEAEMPLTPCCTW